MTLVAQGLILNCVVFILYLILLILLYTIFNVALFSLIYFTIKCCVVFQFFTPVWYRNNVLNLFC